MWRRRMVAKDAKDTAIAETQSDTNESSNVFVNKANDRNRRTSRTMRNNAIRSVLFASMCVAFAWTANVVTYDVIGGDAIVDRLNGKSTRSRGRFKSIRQTLDHQEPKGVRFEAVRAAIRHAWKGYAGNFLRPRDGNEKRLSGGVSGGGIEVDTWNAWYTPVGAAEGMINIFGAGAHVPPDDVAPVTNGAMEWLHHSATVHDSLDTLYLAGLDEEYEQARDYILRHEIQSSSFRPTKIFEYSLRVVGGLLGAYSLTGDLALLSRAKDAADAMLASAFEASTSALPRPFDLLFPPRGKYRFMYRLFSRAYELGRDHNRLVHRYSSLAAVGSFALEFHALSQLTGNDRCTFYESHARSLGFESCVRES